MSYFHNLTKETPTRFWVNNPSDAEVDKAIAAGAINCTTNPAYCAKLLASDTDYIHSVIDDVLFNETREIEEAAVLVYQRASMRIMDRFLPLYHKSDGMYGYVTMQDDPREDQDTNAIIRMALKNRKLGPNYMAKIPVIKGGLEAIETCVEENIAICATEVFGISQAFQVCDIYEAACRRTGNRPPFYVTHITGIMDEYLDKVTRRENIDIAPEVLAQAGCAIARKEYRMLTNKGYHTTLLGGGARGTHHFTEMVGGNIHITINWSTAQQIIDSDMPIRSRIDAEPSQAVIDELTEKLDDFRRAYLDDGLSIDEFADFGPVQLFRNAFLKGWYQLLSEVASRRHLYAI